MVRIKLGLLVFVLAIVGCGGPSPMVENPLITGVNFVGMSVRTVSESVGHLKYAVELKEIELDSTPFKKLEVVPERVGLLRGANAHLLLMQFEHGARSAAVPVNGPGIAHICYQVDAKTKAYQKFIEGGATHIGDPNLVQLRSGVPVSYAYAKDRDGIVFEVEHVDIDQLDLPEPPPHQYRIRHVSIATSDMSKSLDFYSSLLEQPRPRRAGRFFKLRGEALDKISGFPNSKIQMAWFQTHNLELEIIQYHNPVPKVAKNARSLDALGYNMIVFNVSDLSRVANWVKQAGGELLEKDAEVMGQKTVFARDPDGNLLGFQEATIDSPVSSYHFDGNGA